MTTHRDARQARVYLVGDSTFDIRTGLLALLRQGHNPLLQAFFAAAYRVLRAEIAGLTSTQRAGFPRFSSIQDLLALQCQSPLRHALHAALVCTFQLAVFISRCGESDDIFTQIGDSYLVGLCTGALPAAAVSASRHVSDLLKLAPHSVRVAFRAAFRAQEVGQSIERGSEAWSYAVSGVTEDEVREAVSEFCREKSLPTASRPYVSFAAKACITVTGPPSHLRALRESKLSGRRVIDLDLYAPYHAPHLFTAEDVEAVLLGTTPADDWSRYTIRLPVISAWTGALKSARNYHELLRGAVEDILINPILWEDVVNGIAYVSRFSSSDLPLAVCAVGTTSEGTLRNGLKLRGHAVETSTLLAEAPLRTPPDQSDATNAPRASAYNNAAGKSKLAIVGMSGRFPEAEDPEAFWNILFRGLDVHKVVPASRWNAATHVDPAAKRKNTSGAPFGCWLDNPGLFDAKFFNVTPREAPQIDPASRLALMTAYEAMEQAGMVPGATPSTRKDRVGVAYGVTSNDWMEVNSAQNIDTFFIPGGCRAFIPGRVNYFFKFSGPSFAQDTACSSSLSAIHNACNMLWQGDVDTMIAGGTNILTNPDYTAGLDRGHFLSRTGNCKSFDESADGYCRAEGCCTIIIKRLEDAIAESDPILAVILGAGTNHSAEADSITRPLADAQKQLFQKILNDASVDAHDISYVEMHGTGTRAGDPVEMESVVDAFAPPKDKGGLLARGAEKPLYVGAVKSNVGHGEAAAGITSLAKVLLMMKHDTIPPHAGLRTEPNRNFPRDMDERNVHIARRALEWKAGDAPRRAFINNFSAAGGNSALLIEDAPKRPALEGVDPRPTHVIAVSAKTPASVKRNLESLIAFLDQNMSSSTAVSLPALSYTTTARRAHHPHRVAVRGADLGEVQAELRKALERGDGSTRTRAPPPITFAFTGNGSQYVGMGRSLFDTSPTFRGDMTRFDQMVQQQGFPSVMSIIVCPRSDGSRAESIDSFDAVTVQVATVCLEMAVARLWLSWGIKPTSVVGHSLGEYAALAVAGVLSESDAIYLVARRAQLLQQRCQRGSHCMLAVRASQAVLDRHLAGRRFDIACVNGPDDVVLAGTADELRQIQDLLRPQGVKGTMLTVPYAFHSAQVDPILEELEAASRGLTFRKPTIPVICPLLGIVAGVQDANVFSPNYLRRHCREPVNIFAALRSAHSTGVLSDRSVILETGPQPIICGMVKNTFGGDSGMAVLPSLKQGQDAFAVLTQSLSSLYMLGFEIDWREYHSSFPMSHHVVSLPAYNWDLKEYWLQYVNDWSLRKGDPVPDSLKAPILFDVEKASAALKPSQPSSLLAPAVPKLESTAIHKVTQDALVGQMLTIVTETDLSRADIKALAQGHKVNKIPLSTPALYAEIALRVGEHIIDAYAPHLRGRVIGIEDLTIERALVAHGGPAAQILQSSFEFNTETGIANCRFATIDPRTQKPRQHSHCKLLFHDRESRLNAVRKRLEPARNRIEALDKELSTGKAFRFSKAMIYKIVGSLAQFDPEYRQLDEIVLDSAAMDASSRVSLGGLAAGMAGLTFHSNPAAIDALGQSAGFIMNGNESADLENEVFVNHGWQSCQLFEKIDYQQTYRTYCKMEEKPAKRWEGDCIVLDGKSDRVVAWFGGINLQGVPRRVLQYILSNENSAGPTRSAVKADPKAVRPAERKEAHPATAAATATATAAVVGTPAPSPVHRRVTALNPAPVTAQIPTPAPTTMVASVPVARSQPRSGSKIIQQVLQIFSDETGIPTAELSDTAELADLGVDSLLTLQIASRLTEDMEINIGPSEFAELLTIKDLCAFVDPKGYASGPISEVAVQHAAEAPVAEFAVSEQHQPVPTANTAPRPFREAPDLPAAVAPEVEVAGNDGLAAKALQIISEESGVPVEELTGEVVFADLGVDSLLSLMITARFREELELELPSDASFFFEFPTVRDLESFLGLGASSVVSKPVPTQNAGTHSSSGSISTSDGGDGISTEATSRVSTPILKSGTAWPVPVQSVQVTARPASSVILSGRPRTDPQTLFLFPDGSGCATSYAAMAPFVRPGLAVIGLNCPYFRHPEEMSPSSLSLDALMESYLTELRRRQPAGPYRLGGWSSGGILAYRAAQMLIQQGEQIDSLVLIDAPPPTGLDPLPPRWYEHCAKANIFGSMPGSMPSSSASTSGAPPVNLVLHFRNQVKMLQHYMADPLPEGFTPRTTIVWAGKQVFDGRPGRPIFEVSPEDPEGIKFLTEQRTDWSAGAWKELFPLDEPEVSIMEGEDHFSMMLKGSAGKLAKLVSDACL